MVEDHISALVTKDPNKLKVYLKIKEYKITINEVTQIISGDTIIEYDGRLITGEQLYEMLQNSPS